MWSRTEEPERWEPVPDYFGYEISNKGDVRRVYRKTSRPVKMRSGRHGIPKISTTRDGKSVTLSLEGVMLEMFGVTWISEELWHGTPGGYSNHACRCGECVEAWNSWHRAHRTKVREKARESSHGTFHRYESGCRCSMCERGAKNRKANQDRKDWPSDLYETLVASEGEWCQICGVTPAPGRKLRIDHDHVTGQPRGLLCDKCNTGLGKLGDTPEGLKRAILYLERPSPI